MSQEHRVKLTTKDDSTSFEASMNRVDNTTSASSILREDVYRKRTKRAKHNKLQPISKERFGSINVKQNKSSPLDVVRLGETSKINCDQPLQASFAVHNRNRLDREESAKKEIKRRSTISHSGHYPLASQSSNILRKSGRTNFIFTGLSKDAKSGLRDDESDNITITLSKDEMDFNSSLSIKNSFDENIEYACDIAQTQASYLESVGEEEEVLEVDFPLKDNSCHNCLYLEGSKIAYLSAYAILGCLCRVLIGRILGSECVSDSNDTSTWMYPVAIKHNLCLTSNGQTHQNGGALFIDLPVNMLGSFIMGLLQSAPGLNLAGANPIACLPSDHWFQSWKVSHLAIRTGFCGSLTTFASWNSQMIVMMEGSMTELGTQIFKAMFGYALGLASAMASFQTGRQVAIWLYRLTNPNLAKEDDLIRDECNEMTMKANRLLVHRGLPDFERMYLTHHLDGKEAEFSQYKTSDLNKLNRWRSTTETHRMLGSGFQVELQDIERRIIIEGKNPNSCLIRCASNFGWDVSSLKKWVVAKQKHKCKSSICQKGMTKSKQYVAAAFPFCAAAGIAMWYGLMETENGGEYFTLYRTLWVTALFAPPGALIRWKLSIMNGKVAEPFAWLPIGTVCANVLASTISALTLAIEVIIADSASKENLYLLAAVKTGFAGSLSTVSTFVAEVHSLNTKYPHRAVGFVYAFGSLFLACIIGLMIYIPAVKSV